jgi:hypothetical protein
MLWQICLVRQFNTCNLQINSLFHTKNLLLDFDDTVYTTQYDKCVSDVVNFSLHCNRSICNASPIESQHFFFAIFIMLCVCCPKPPVCHVKFTDFVIYSIVDTSQVAIYAAPSNLLAVIPIFLSS